jgi:hypothetical protein
VKNSMNERKCFSKDNNRGPKRAPQRTRCPLSSKKTTKQ